MRWSITAKKAVAVPRGGAAIDFDNIVAADRVAGREVFAPQAAQHFDVERIHLHQIPRLADGVPVDPTLGVRPLPAPPAGPPARLDQQATGFQPAQDAPDRGGGEAEPFPPQEHGEFLFAPARILGPQLPNALDDRGRRLRLPEVMRAPGAQVILETLETQGIIAPRPAVEDIWTEPKVPAGFSGITPVPHIELHPSAGACGRRARATAQFAAPRYCPPGPLAH